MLTHYIRISLVCDTTSPKNADIQRSLGQRIGSLAAWSEDLPGKLGNRSVSSGVDGQLMG